MCDAAVEDCIGDDSPSAYVVKSKKLLTDLAESCCREMNEEWDRNSFDVDRLQGWREVSQL